MNLITGDWSTTLSQEFLVSEKSDNFDKERVFATLPYIDALLICLNIVRLILVAISYKKPSICKQYLPLQMLYWAVRSTALIDLGDVAC